MVSPFNGRNPERFSDGSVLQALRQSCHNFGLRPIGTSMLFREVSGVCLSHHRCIQVSQPYEKHEGVYMLHKVLKQKICFCDLCSVYTALVGRESAWPSIFVHDNTGFIRRPHVTALSRMNWCRRSRSTLCGTTTSSCVASIRPASRSSSRSDTSPRVVPRCSTSTSSAC